MVGNEELKQEASIDGGLVNEHGTITVSEKVVTALVAAGAAQIEGLGQKRSTVTEDVGRIFGSKRRGVSIEFSGNEVTVTLKIAVKQGYPVHEVAKKTQKKIKEDVETKTGLQVNSVDVYVQKLQEIEDQKTKPASTDSEN